MLGRFSSWRLGYVFSKTWVRSHGFEDKELLLFPSYVIDSKKFLSIVKGCVPMKLMRCIRWLFWDLVFLRFINEFSTHEFIEKIFNSTLFLLPMWWMSSKRLVWESFWVKYTCCNSGMISGRKKMVPGHKVLGMVYRLMFHMPSLVECCSSV